MRTIDYFIDKEKEQREIDRSVRHDEFIAEFYEKNAELKQIDSEIVAQRTNKIIATLAGDIEAARAAEILKQRLSDRREDYLKSHNISNDYENEFPICDKCKDTGFIDNKGHRMVCKCMNEAKELCYIASGLGNFSSISKKTYDENYGNSLEKRKVVRKSLTDIYLHNKKSKNNIWLYIDGVQTGKTFLSIVIAKQIISRGDSCAYIKLEDIQDMTDTMNEIVVESDVLFVDDYSSVLTTTGSIGSILNNILEIRSSQGLPTIVISIESKVEITAESDVRIAGKLNLAERV